LPLSLDETADGVHSDLPLAILRTLGRFREGDLLPKFVSPADPAARWTRAHGGQAFFAYSTNYLIDVDNGIIVDVEATTVSGAFTPHS
jgi:hypothetical protein